MKKKPMRENLWYACTLLSVWLLVPGLHAQVENQGRPVEYTPQVYAEAFTFESDQLGKSRVDIYVQIPYPEISFVKESEQYTGRLEISVVVNTTDHVQIWQKSDMVELRVKEFSQTISNNHSSLKQFSTDLAPGTYNIQLQITDQESKKIASLQKSMVVRDVHQDSLAVSDLMLVHRVSNEGNRKHIVPNLTGTLEQEPGTMYLFFEIYHKTQLDSVSMVCKFLNTKKEVVAHYTKQEGLSERRTQVVWQIDTPALAADRYILTVDIESVSKVPPGKTYRSSMSRSCLVQMKNLPSTVTDLDQATDQLVYIAKESEMDMIREATTSTEKLKRFLAFWAKHDPDPKTPRNELMEEYYARVAYADKNFGNYREGWKTDRGRVLIQFGPPQNVERHPFDAESKPYEVWYYYEQNRQFVFVDDSGFGDYRQRYPETDLWGRVR
jgi:GWxTD domain-containing protein